jgi:hypothetical protein
MHVQRKSVTVTTDESGDATAFIEAVAGRLSVIRYTKTDYDNGVDFDVTVEDTGEVLWDEDDVNASKNVAPRQATHDTAGVAALYESTTNEPALDYIIVAGRIKIVVGSGGNTKTGAFEVIVF